MIGFVHIPKTAGTTLKFVLRNSFGPRHCDVLPHVRDGLLTDADLTFARRAFPFGIRSISGHALEAAPVRLRTPVRFYTFLRDPLARCLSNYQHRVRALARIGEELPFPRYLADPSRWNLQVRFLAGAPDLDRAKDVLRGLLCVGLTERFATSLRLLRAVSPYPIDLRYERRHVTKDNRARDAVLADARSRRLLEEANALDLELYRYARDEEFPARLAAAGLDGPEAREDDHRHRGFPLGYKAARVYNQAVYRTLVKIRRRLRSAR